MAWQSLHHADSSLRFQSMRNMSLEDTLSKRVDWAQELAKVPKKHHRMSAIELDFNLASRTMRTALAHDFGGMNYLVPQGSKYQGCFWKLGSLLWVSL